jgi:1,4-dihydroxy-2-naphthoate octaprenyltransferase
MGELSLGLWLRELRAPFFTATIVPVLIGAAVACSDSSVVDLPLLSLTLLAALCLHAGSNMANDYYDYLSGCDTHPQYEEFSAPFFGGSRLLPEGLIQARDVHRASLLAIGIGIAIGLYLVWKAGWPILVLGLIGVFSGYLYVTLLAPRGLGEVSVFLNFGPLMVLGSQFVQVGRFSFEALLVSIPVGVFIAAVLWINEIPDLEADRAVGKDTLVVRLGRKSAVDVYMAMLIVGYVCIIVLSLARIIPICALISLASIPLALRSIGVSRAHYEEPSKMVAANAGMVMVHAVTGLLIVFSYPLCGWLSAIA